MLKRFRKTIQDATGSPGRTPSNDAGPPKQDEASGFICPMCMAGFKSPDLLQVHFDQAHAENPAQTSEPEPAPQSTSVAPAATNQHETKRKPGELVESKSDNEPLHAVSSKPLIQSPNRGQFDSSDGDSQKVTENSHSVESTGAIKNESALQQEISDLEASLNEEKWYSKELKGELEKRESENKAQSEELELVKNQMGIAIQTNETLAREKETVLNKLATKSQECATLQSQIDDFKSEKAQMLESANNQSVELEKAASWIRDLEAQLNERPASDDFVVLKKELVSVQMLMDQLTQDSEKQKEEAEGRCSELSEMNSKLKEEIEDLKQTHSQALQEQKKSKEVLVESFQKKDSESAKLQEIHSAEVEKVKEELDNAQSALETEQAHGRNLEMKNNNLEERLISEKEEKENFRKELQSVKEEVSSLKKEIEIQKVELSNKEQSREKVQKKLDDLMQQMGKTSSETDITMKERDSRIESLTQEYDDATAALAAAKRESEKLAASNSAIQNELDKLREAHKQLELTKSLDEQKYAQEMDELKSKLSQAHSSDSELQKRIEQLELEARKAWDENQEEKAKSKMTILENENQILSLKTGNEKLGSEIQQYKTLLQEEESKRKGIDESLANMLGQVKNLENEKMDLVAKNENHQKMLQEADAKVDTLLKEKESVLADVKRLQQERSDLTEKMEVGEGQAILVGQLKDENQSLLKRLEENNAKFKDQQSQYETASKEYENVIAENKASMKQLQEELATNQSSRKNLESALASLRGENSQNKTKLLGRDEELKRLQDTLSNQKLEFESKISLLQRSLDEKTRDYDKVLSTFEGFKTSSESSLRAMEKSRADFQDRFTAVKEENTKMEMELKARDEKLSLKEADIASLNTAVENLNEQHKNEMDTVKTRHRDKKSALEAQLAVSQEQHTALKQELESANSKTAEVEANLTENVKKIKIFELDIKDKEESMAGLKSRVESSEADVARLKEELQKLKEDNLEQVAQLGDNHSKAVKVLQVEHKKTCDDLKAEIENRTSKHEEQIRVMKAELEKTENSVNLKVSEIEKLDVMVKAKTVELENLKSTSEQHNADFSEKLSVSNSKIAELESMIGHLKLEGSDAQKVLEDKETKLKDLDAKLAQKEQELMDKDETLAAIKTELSSTSQALKESTEELEGTSAKLKETEERLQQSETKNVEARGVVKDLEETLKSSRATNDECNKKLEEADAKIKDAASAMEVKEEEILAMKKYLSMKEKEMTEKNENLSSEIERCKTEIHEKSNMLDEEKELRKQEQESWKEQKERMEEDAMRKESQLNAEKDELVQSQEMLKGAQQILINSKMELQKQLDATLEEIGQEKTKHAEAEKSFRERQVAIEGKLTATTEELEATKQSLKTTADEKQNIQDRLQLEVSTLRDNLDSVRGEWQQALQQVEEKNAESDDLRGQVVVLQATVQNNADERRALLERCIVAEQSVEQLKQNEVQLKRRLDDAQAAMHELGRENQAMQVKHTTVLSRQWADDREAVECVSCRKPFSMTVRKHHCRHCGKIFCAECSSKTMTVASSKKPVRVCEKCYDDLLTVQ